jgi:hypothetical protein
MLVRRESRNVVASPDELNQWLRLLQSLAIFGLLRAVMRRLSLAGGVEKVGDRNVLLAAIIAAIEFSSPPQLRGSFHSRCCRLAEEPH